jgi:hypothetical protein
LLAAPTYDAASLCIECELAREVKDAVTRGSGDIFKSDVILEICIDILENAAEPNMIETVRAGLGGRARASRHTSSSASDGLASPKTSRMTCWQVGTKKGGLAEKVIEIGDMEITRAGPGEVLVRLRASGINPSDYKETRRQRAARISVHRSSFRQRGRR